MLFRSITKNLEDQRWTPDNAGYLLIRRVSALLWKYFEPRHPWSPTRGAETFKP